MDYEDKKIELACLRIDAVAIFKLGISFSDLKRVLKQKIIQHPILTMDFENMAEDWVLEDIHDKLEMPHYVTHFGIEKFIVTDEAGEEMVMNPWYASEYIYEKYLKPLIEDSIQELLTRKE